MPIRHTSALRSAVTLRSSCRRLPRIPNSFRPSTPPPVHLSLSRPQLRLLSYTAARPSSPMAAPTDTEAAQTASESGVTADSLRATLESKLNATYVAVEDMSGGCGQAFNAIIVSPEFDKKSHLQRHRLVNNALKAEIAAIHAWTPRCLTPEQWQKEQGDLKMT